MISRKAMLPLLLALLLCLLVSCSHGAVKDRNTAEKDLQERVDSAAASLAKLYEENATDLEEVALAMLELCEQAGGNLRMHIESGKMQLFSSQEYYSEKDIQATEAYRLAGTLCEQCADAGVLTAIDADTQTYHYGLSACTFSIAMEESVEDSDQSIHRTVELVYFPDEISSSNEALFAGQCPIECCQIQVLAPHWLLSVGY